MPITVFILDDCPDRRARMADVLEAIAPDADLRISPDAPRMIASLETDCSAASLISLDHDLEPYMAGVDEPGSGLDVVACMKRLGPVCPVIVHSTNTQYARIMQGELRLAGWSCTRLTPVGFNWIETDWAALVRKLLAGAPE